MSSPSPSAHHPQLDDAGRALQARHERWWQQEGMLYNEGEGAPLGDLWLPLADGTLLAEDVMLTPDMLDLERLAGDPLEPGPLEFYGDRFSIRSPYARVPWVEAVLGCPIRTTIQGGSMRARLALQRWEDWESRPHRSEAWFGALKKLVEMLVARSGGRYAVVQPTMRGPTDLAEAILGPEMMCLSMYDHPQALRRFLEEVTGVFIEILQAQRQRIPPISGGYVGYFGLWAPGTVGCTQCDASAILSPKQYAEWFQPFDERICRSVDYAAMHLHSVSLHTVDSLLKMDALRALQVTLETSVSAPTLQQMVPTFRRILEDKSLILGGPLSDEDIAYLKRELPHDGLYIAARRSPW